MQSEKLWFLRRRENQSTRRKISRLEARKRTNNRLNPCLVTHIQQQQTQPMYGKLDQARLQFGSSFSLYHYLRCIHGFNLLWHLVCVHVVSQGSFVVVLIL